MEDQKSEDGYKTVWVTATGWLTLFPQENLSCAIEQHPLLTSRWVHMLRFFFSCLLFTLMTAPHSVKSTRVLLHSSGSNSHHCIDYCADGCVCAILVPYRCYCLVCYNCLPYLDYHNLSHRHRQRVLLEAKCAKKLTWGFFFFSLSHNGFLWSKKKPKQTNTNIFHLFVWGKAQQLSLERKKTRTSC